MRDSELTVTMALPAANASNTSPTLDLHVDGDNPFNNTWRLGRIRAIVPALPNHTTGNITLTLQQQPTAGGADANTQPLIQAVIAGIAGGTAAMTIDFPLPPSLDGPLNFFQSVAAGDGNNTAASITYVWLNE